MPVLAVNSTSAGQPPVDESITSLNPHSRANAASSASLKTRSGSVTLSRRPPAASRATRTGTTSREANSRCPFLGSSSISRPSNIAPGESDGISCTSSSTMQTSIGACAQTASKTSSIPDAFGTPNASANPARR